MAYLHTNGTQSVDTSSGNNLRGSCTPLAVAKSMVEVYLTDMENPETYNRVQTQKCTTPRKPSVRPEGVWSYDEGP